MVRCHLFTKLEESRQSIDRKLLYLHRNFKIHAYSVNFGLQIYRLVSFFHIKAFFNEEILPAYPNHSFIDLFA